MLFPRVQQDNRVYATYTQVICQTVPRHIQTLRIIKTL